MESQASAAQAPLEVNFSGTWIKDKDASDPMDEAISLVGLSGLMKQAIKLIKGMDVKQEGDTFTFGLFSVISWFKITESYKLNGEFSRQMRRDLRSGKHESNITIPSPDKLMINLKWEDPYGGTGIDEWQMPSQDQLWVTSSVTVGGKTAKYRQVYNRKK